MGYYGGYGGCGYDPAFIIFLILILLLLGNPQCGCGYGGYYSAEK
ncbi:hypothetical protein JOC37_002178 [Desulfohalotomaculum tongense]|nr:hypothetical protein [Desulforadius tongensis]MBM7855763.1 hypothetical protein [Desulforadius tongensis]